MNKVEPQPTDADQSSGAPSNAGKTGNRAAGAATSSAEDAGDAHPIAAAIDRFIHRVRDTKFAARRHMPIAISVSQKEYKKIGDEVERVGPLLKSADRRTVILAQKELSDIVLRFERLRNSDVAGAIEVGLFLAVFAAFDAFTGELLRALYARKPELFGSISKAIDFSEVLAATSLESLRLQVLDEEIETLRRKSYVDQFATLSSRFDLKLTAFPRWADFVECSQRRNLLTHADGVVNDQYQKICTGQGFGPDKLPPIGTQLKIGPEYFFESCELLIEVGFKLGQTLWRKTLPTDLKDADSHLMATLFGTLESRVWRRARMIGEFGMAQRALATDWNRKAILVNYVQSLKRDDAANEAQRVLDSVDWSSAGHEFRLAERVLREDYDAAGTLVRQIGGNDKLLTEHAYHTWPLFREFRDTDQFSAAYADVFGHSYAAKLEESALKTSVGAAQEGEKQVLAGAEVDAAMERDRTGSESLANASVAMTQPSPSESVNSPTIVA